MKWFLFSFVISFFLTIGTIKVAYRLGVMDYPNERSSHRSPTPRAGGWAIYLAFLGVSLLWFLKSPLSEREAQWFWGLLAGSTLVALVGFVDDLRSLPASWRFILQCLAAALLVAMGIRLDLSSLAFFGSEALGNVLEVSLSFLWLVTMVNFFNFMDGIDGLAAGEACIVSFFLFLLATMAQFPFLAGLSLVLLGAALGFLFHNFPPAKVFMGDGGSLFLGLLLASLCLLAGQGSGKPVLSFIPFILLASFFFDAFFTLMRRMSRGEKWFSAHRSHYYQRLVLLGYTHKRVTLGEYGLSILLGLSAIASYWAGMRVFLALLSLWMFLFFAMAWWVRHLERRGQRGHAFL